jgi:hypothetical protein
MGDDRDIIERLLDFERCGLTAIDRVNLRECAAIEIARLRRALESLTKDPPATLDEPDEDWEVVVKMRAIAQAALDGCDVVVAGRRPVWIQQADGSYKAGWEPVADHQ